MLPSPRRLAALLAVTLAFGLAACDGGDASPTAPAQDAGTGEDTMAPAEGQNVPLQDPGDNLEEPAPDEPADFSDEADQ